jgi:hypothetical protein
MGAGAGCSEAGSGGKSRHHVLRCGLPAAAGRQKFHCRSGPEPQSFPYVAASITTGRALVNGIIYLVGLVVVVMFILSFLGLR